MTPGRALSDCAMLGRLTRDLPAFLRTPITAEQAAATVRRRLDARPERFIAMAERMIYGHPRSPYLRLLRAAGCELGDLRVLVAREGLEGALSRLAGAGVYVAFDELKGRTAAVRGSERFAFTEADFDNPYLASHFEMPTGGTRGVPSRVQRTLPFLADVAVDVAVALAAHGLSRSGHVVWRTAPMTDLLIAAKLACPTIAWFYPLTPLPLKVRAGARYLALLGRLVSHRFPTPVFADLQDPGELAHWLGRQLRRGGPISLTTYASSAVRIAVAAKDRGIALDGLWFVTMGEPFTRSRQRLVEATGARAIVRYGFIEAAYVGYLCGHPSAADDVHLFSDRFGLVQRTRALDDSGLSVAALLFTTISPLAPKILLNAESGDTGLVEQRSCGCGLGALGLRDHISEIRSFEKLTGEGMTFAKTDLLHVLEEALPSRFGGTGVDYQLVEDEGKGGRSRLLLLVSPRLGPVDEPELRRVFLEELGRSGQIESYMASMWRRAGTVEIRRQSPLPTSGAKIFPFHLIKE